MWLAHCVEGHRDANDATSATCTLQQNAMPQRMSGCDVACHKIAYANAYLTIPIPANTAGWTRPRNLASEDSCRHYIAEQALKG